MVITVRYLDHQLVVDTYYKGEDLRYRGVEEGEDSFFYEYDHEDFASIIYKWKKFIDAILNN